MTLSLTCSKCGKHYPKVNSKLAGRKARCRCGHEMRISTVSEKAPSPVSPKLSDSKKLHPKQLQPTTGAGKPSLSEPPPSTMDLHYSDLDQILAGSGEPDGPVGPATEHHFQRAEFSPPVAISHALRTNRTATEPPVATKTPSARLTISFLAVVASASIAFWFGSFVVLSRFVKFDHFLLSGFTEAMTNLNAGQFGLDEIAPGLRVGLVIAGWLIWSMAVAMVVLAALQFGSALIQLFIQKQPLRWVDGLMGACGVALLFLFVATLFFHSTHIANLKRPLKRFDSVETASMDETELQNVQRIREHYDSESQRFMTVILVAGLAPLSVFGCSMVRLLTRRT